MKKGSHLIPNSHDTLRELWARLLSHHLTQPDLAFSMATGLLIVFLFFFSKYGAPLILFLTSLIQHINQSERSRSATLSSKNY